MRNYCNVFFLLLVFAWALGSCKEKCSDPCDINCESHNPCDCIQPLVADFAMEEEVYDEWFELINPINSGGKSIRFRVKTPNYDSCIWILGAETLRVKQFIRRYFPDNYVVKATLIVFRKNGSDCHSDYKKSDTLTKSFRTGGEDYFTNKIWPLFGSYVGYKKSNPNQLITITIDTISPTTYFPYIHGIHITNFPYNFNNYSAPKYIYNIPGPPAKYPYEVINFTKFWGSSAFKSSFQEGNFEGTGRLIGDELVIQWHHYRDTLPNGTADRKSPILYDEFKGKKTN